MTTIIRDKSVYDILVAKGITTNVQAIEHIKGRKVKTIKSRANPPSGHNYPSKFTIAKTISSPGASFNVHTMFNNLAEGGGRNSIYLEELCFDVSTKQDLVEELENIKNIYNIQSKDIEEKLAILEELSIEEYDEKLIRVIQAINTSNSTEGTKIDKAKKILELIQ